VVRAVQGGNCGTGEIAPKIQGQRVAEKGAPQSRRSCANFDRKAVLLLTNLPVQVSGRGAQFLKKSTTVVDYFL